MAFFAKILTAINLSVISSYFITNVRVFIVSFTVPIMNALLETKNIWARDDPAIVLIICGMLCVSALTWGITYHLSIWGIIRLTLLMVFRDFLGSGLIIASGTWFVSLLVR